MPPSTIPKSCLSSSTSSSACRAIGQRAAAQTSRGFSASTNDQARLKTRARRSMFRWLNGPGSILKDPLPGSSNYLGAIDKTSGELKRLFGKPINQAIEENGGLPPATTSSDLRPFPVNKNFVSSPVLSEELREQVWSDIMLQGLSVREVSANRGMSMERVGAVVRLKEVEKQWARQGKRLAKPYARAIMDMLPTTDLSSTKQHESVNDLPVHAATEAQIFYPVSESRQFTREDAATVFEEGLLPAEHRIPHPDMVVSHKERLSGLSPKELKEKAEARAERDYEAAKLKLERKAKWEANNIKVVPSTRWNFKFQEISVDMAGKDGKGKDATGWRYGVPLNDRKRGQIKIPRSVA